MSGGFIAEPERDVLPPTSRGSCQGAAIRDLETSNSYLLLRRVYARKFENNAIALMTARQAASYRGSAQRCVYLWSVYRTPIRATNASPSAIFVHVSRMIRASLIPS